MNYQTYALEQANEQQRAQFYRKTYLHVAAAVLAFVGMEYALIHSSLADTLFSMMIGSTYSWLLVIGIFWIGSVVAQKWSLSQSRGIQYLGLAFYVILEALIFLPMIYLAANQAGGVVLYQAATLTLALFAGLSGVALTSKRDFSFLRSYILIGGFLSLGLIVAGSIFGFNLGLSFSVGMVLLASISILYQTNKLNSIYHTDQYVGAALSIFASVMLLFWYILRIFMSSRD